VFKDLGIVARVEEDTSAAIFDQRGITPILCQEGGFAEGVVEDRDTISRLGSRYACAQ